MPGARERCEVDRDRGNPSLTALNLALRGVKANFGTQIDADFGVRSRAASGNHGKAAVRGRPQPLAVLRESIFRQEPADSPTWATAVWPEVAADGAFAMGASYRIVHGWTFDTRNESKPPPTRRTVKSW